MDKIATVEKAVAAVAGSREVKSKLSKARRALKGRNDNPDKAVRMIEESLDILAGELVWRRRAVTELMPELKVYDSAIKGSIGLRLQKRLSLDEAKYIASCQSEHRDISLHF